MEQLVGGSLFCQAFLFYITFLSHPRMAPPHFSLDGAVPPSENSVVRRGPMPRLLDAAPPLARSVVFFFQPGVILLLAAPKSWPGPYHPSKGVADPGK